MKNIIYYFFCVLSFSQTSQFPYQLNTNSGCYDDDYTISVGMSLYDNSILNCEDAIIYLNNFGYGCNTSLAQINNPFWGSNPNETISNICGCYCLSENVVYGCTDELACNYNADATDDDGSCEYIVDGECDCDGSGPISGYDCEGNCLSDLDNDGICDFEDDCPFDPENDIDGDGICSDCDTMVFIIEDCECEFLDPATYTLFYINEDEENCITTEVCYCECYNDIDNDGICDENENQGCMDITACNYDDTATEDDGSCAFPGDPCELDNGTMGIYNDLCECVVDTSYIKEYNNHKTIIKVVDVLGRELLKSNILIIIYNDGSVEKKYIIE